MSIGGSAPTGGASSSTAPTRWHSRRSTPIWKPEDADENDAALDLGEGVGYLSFQRDADYEPPVWPGATGRQRMMMHLDFEVSDLAAAVEHALELGASLPDHQPQDDVRVLLDPAGHPFCLYT